MEYAWLIPELNHSDRLALTVLGGLVSKEISGTGEHFDAIAGGRLGRDLFRISSTGPESRKNLDNLLNNIRQRVYSEKEIDSVKKNLVAEFENLSIHSRPYFSLASQVGIFDVLGLPNYPASYSSRVSAVTKKDLRRVLKLYLKPVARFEIAFDASKKSSQKLPEKRGELLKAAQNAEASGNLARADAAYTKLLVGKLNKMNQIIYISSRGQIRMRRKLYDSAISDFEAALKIYDYPRVRELLSEARDRKQKQGLAFTEEKPPSR